MPDYSPEEKFKRLIHKLSPAYYPEEPDFLEHALDCDNVGDGLATFIVNECRDLFDPELSERENLAEMSRAMERACGQLCAVGNEMSALRYSSSPLREMP